MIHQAFQKVHLEDRYATIKFLEINQLLKENNIEFTDYNVAEDGEKRKEMMDKTGQMGVPVIIISEEGENPTSETLIGFDKTKLSELLGVS